MGNKENIVDNEVLQNETQAGEFVEEVGENDVVLNYEEVLANMYEEMQEQTGLLAETREEQIEINQALVALEGVLLVMVVMGLLEFCWSCMRQWRKNVLEMGE